MKYINELREGDITHDICAAKIQLVGKLFKFRLHVVLI